MIASGNRRIKRLCQDEFAVGEVWCRSAYAWNNVAFLAHQVKEDALRRTAMVRRITCENDDGLMESRTWTKLGEPEVGLVKSIIRRPCSVGHGDDAESSQVDQDCFRRQQERAVSRASMKRWRSSRVVCGWVSKLLDAKWFNNWSLGNRERSESTCRHYQTRAIHSRDERVRRAWSKLFRLPCEKNYFFQGANIAQPVRHLFRRQRLVGQASSGGSFGDGFAQICVDNF